MKISIYIVNILKIFNLIDTSHLEYICYNEYYSNKHVVLEGSSHPLFVILRNCLFCNPNLKIIGIYSIELMTLQKELIGPSVHKKVISQVSLC